MAFSLSASVTFCSLTLTADLTLGDDGVVNVTDLLAGRLIDVAVLTGDEGEGVWLMGVVAADEKVGVSAVSAGSRRAGVDGDATLRSTSGIGIGSSSSITMNANLTTSGGGFARRLITRPCARLGSRGRVPDIA